MRAGTHIDVVALLIEAYNGILWQVVNVLHLIFFAALLHEGNGLRTGQNEGFDRQVFLYNAAHFVFDGGQVVHGKGGVAKVDIVIKALVGGGTVGEIRLRIQVHYSLSHNMCGAVAYDMQLLVGGAFSNSAVIIDDLHSDIPFLPKPFGPKAAL